MKQTIKKIFSIFLTFVCIFLIAGCHGNKDNKEIKKKVEILLTENNQVEVGATSFDFTKMFIIKVDDEEIEVTKDMIDSSEVNLNQVGSYKVVLSAYINDTILNDKEYATKYTKEATLNVIAKSSSLKTVEIKETNVSKEIKKGDTTFDFTKLFQITVDGEDVEVKKEWIDTSKVDFNTPNTYEVTLTYTLDGKDYTKTIEVEVKETVTEKVVLISETTESKEIENGDTTFDFTKLFQITVDGEDVEVKKEWIDTSKVNFNVANTYEVTLNYVLDGKTYSKTVNVTVKAGATQEELQLLATAANQDYSNYTLTIHLDDTEIEIIERTLTALHANLGTLGEVIFILNNGIPTKYYSKDAQGNWKLNSGSFMSAWNYQYAPYMYDVEVESTDFNYQEGVYILKNASLEKYDYLLAPYSDKVHSLQLKVENQYISEIQIQGNSTSYKMYFSQVGTTAVEDPKIEQSANNEFAGIYTYAGIYITISNDEAGRGTVTYLSGESYVYDYVIAVDEQGVRYLDVKEGDYTIYKSDTGIIFTDVYGDGANVSFKKTDKIPEPTPPEELPENPDNLPYIGKFNTYDSSGNKTSIVIRNDGTCYWFSSSNSGTWTLDPETGIIHMDCKWYVYDIKVIDDSGILLAMDTDYPDDIDYMRIFVPQDKQFQSLCYSKGEIYLTMYSNLTVLLYQNEAYVVTTEDLLIEGNKVRLYSGDELIVIVMIDSFTLHKLSVIESTADTYKNGSDVLILDGFGMATYNGEQCKYYSTPNNRVVLEAKSGRIGIQLNLTDKTFTLAEQDGHQGDYISTSGTVKITIDGWGGLIWDVQDEMLSPSLYTYVIDGKDLTATISGVDHFFTFKSYGNALVRKSDNAVFQKVGTRYEIEVELLRSDVSNEIPYGDTDFDFTKLFKIYEDGFAKSITMSMIDISAVRFTVAGTYPVILTYTSLQTKETYTETFEVVVLSEEQSTLPAFLGEYTYADYGYTLTLEKDNVATYVEGKKNYTGTWEYEAATNKLTISLTDDSNSSTKRNFEATVEEDGILFAKNTAYNSIILFIQSATDIKVFQVTPSGTLTVASYTRDEVTKLVAIKDNLYIGEVQADESLFVKDNVVSIQKDGDELCAVKVTSSTETSSYGKISSEERGTYQSGNDQIFADGFGTLTGTVEGTYRVVQNYFVVTTKSSDEVTLKITDQNYTVIENDGYNGDFVDSKDSNSLKYTLHLNGCGVATIYEGKNKDNETFGTYVIHDGKLTIVFDPSPYAFRDSYGTVELTQSQNGNILTGTILSSEVIFTKVELYKAFIEVSQDVVRLLDTVESHDFKPYFTISYNGVAVEVTDEMIDASNVSFKTPGNYKVILTYQHDDETYTAELSVEIYTLPYKDSSLLGTYGSTAQNKTYKDYKYTFELFEDGTVKFSCNTTVRDEYDDLQTVVKTIDGTFTYNDEDKSIKIECTSAYSFEGTVKNGIFYVHKMGVEEKYSDYYCFIKDATLTDVYTSSSAYLNKFTVADGSLYIFQNGKNQYGVVEVEGDIAAGNNVVIKQNGEEIALLQFTSASAFVLPSEERGTYQVGEDSFTLDGFGSFTSKDKTGTYQMIQDKILVEVGEETFAYILQIKERKATAIEKDSYEGIYYHDGGSSTYSCIYYTITGYGILKYGNGQSIADKYIGTYTVKDNVITVLYGTDYSYELTLGENKLTVTKQIKWDVWVEEGWEFKKVTPTVTISSSNSSNQIKQGDTSFDFKSLFTVKAKKDGSLAETTYSGSALASATIDTSEVDFNAPGTYQVTIIFPWMGKKYVGTAEVEVVGEGTKIVEITQTNASTEISGSATDFDFTKLFNITVDGEDVPVIPGMINATAVKFGQAGTYDVVLTYTVDGKSYTKTVQVTVKEKVVEITEADGTKEIENGDTSFDFTKLFKITVDAIEVPVESNMIDASAVQFDVAGEYDVTLTYTVDEKPYTLTVKVKVLAVGEEVSSNPFLGKWVNGRGKVCVTVTETTITVNESGITGEFEYELSNNNQTLTFDYDGDPVVLTVTAQGIHLYYEFDEVNQDYTKATA